MDNIIAVVLEGNVQAKRAAESGSGLGAELGGKTTNK